MPVKQVYGKKAKKSTAFVSSKAFRWSSSPEKTHGPIEATQRIEEIAVALSTLKLEEDEVRPQTPPIERPVLKARDSNAVVKPRLPTRRRERSPAQKPTIRQSPRLAAKIQDAETLITTEEPLLSPTKQKNCLLESNRAETRRPRTNSSRVERHDSVLDPATDEFSHARPLLNLVTDSEWKHAPLSFRRWTEDLGEEFTITKIAEASFAQVYLLSRRDPTGIANDDQSILKIISLNCEKQDDVDSVSDKRPQKVQETSSDIDKVVSEVRLLDRMTEIPGFTNLREIRVLQGQPSAPFIAAWREWNKSRSKKDKSIFPDPSRKANYAEDQLWAVVEMDHAGFDLEHPSVKIDTLWSLWDVFWGVAIAIAKGEEDVNFEHRDLHLGNICVTQTRPDDALQRPQIRNVHQKLGFTGLETTIIDYTLSRAEVSNSCLSGDSEVVYIDLAKEEIFDGDASENYQYEIYRYMRNAVFLGKPLEVFNRNSPKVERLRRSWRDSHLETNLIWLHFILHELYAQIPRRKGSSLFDESFENYGNERDREMARKRRGIIEHALSAIKQRLNLKDFHRNGLKSVRDLVVWALDERWLDPEDVSGNQTSIEELEQRLHDLRFSSRDLNNDCEANPDAVPDVSIKRSPARARRKR
ncbi:hypothetical protein NA57DRAFT_70668 [Rhizodiscina lignyota]|uniref:non-specific serine/threonine protein kinase n=1 Tax=Rhizodiscina lignyota TaxID=1504668 RepID=A0A9P4IRH7_9PEZI|nr:hypothetical protein NA57DRAFT_70668 [Rhizodiscina lignyota]